MPVVLYLACPNLTPAYISAATAGVATEAASKAASAVLCMVHSLGYFYSVCVQPIQHILCTGRILSSMEVRIKGYHKNRFISIWFVS